MAISFKERAYQHIRTKLLDGGFSAGERLSEEALAAEIGISRTPVREALNRLASEGLASQLPHYGVFVRTFERDELAELYDLRALLESYAAGWAATRRTDQQLAELLELCQTERDIARQFRKADSDQALSDVIDLHSRLDQRFHLLMLEAARCSHTMKVATDMSLLTQLCGRRRFVAGEDLLYILGRTLREHVAIVRAVRREDGETAAAWMRRHLLRGKREGLIAFDASQESETVQDRNHIDRYQSITPDTEPGDTLP